MQVHFDRARTGSIMSSFYTLTNIQIDIFNERCEHIEGLEGVRSPFCRYVRSIPEVDARCRACDQRACEACRNQGRGFSYHCHLGLEESITPIKYADMIVGYVLSGQRVPYGRKEQVWAEVVRELAPFHLDMHNVRALFDSQRELSPEMRAAAFEILEACASYICQRDGVRVEEQDPFYRLNSYILQNLSGDLSVSAICQALYMNKSTLNRIAHQYLQTSIQPYIQKLRIEEAQRYLRTTAFSVKEIATLVGIPDYNYFTKVFTRMVGVSPSRYRNETQGAVPLEFTL